MINRIEVKYETLDEVEKGWIMYLKIEFDEIFNISNLVITSLHYFIKNFYKDGIDNIPNVNI